MIILVFLLSFGFSGELPAFTDRSIEALAGSKFRTTLIYSVTPKMPLSMKGLIEIPDIANSLHADWKIFTSAEDLDVVCAALPRACTENRIFRNQSFDLVQLGMKNHDPSLAMVVDGKIIPRLIQGYDVPSTSLTRIKDFLTHAETFKRLPVATKADLKEEPNSAYPLAHKVERQDGPVLIAGIAIQRQKIKERATFFYKPDPDGKYVGFTTFENDRGRKESNYVLDLADGHLYAAPGLYDPVFPLVSYYLVSIVDAGEISFYHLPDILRRERAARPFLRETDLTGYYQSFGRFQGATERSSFRMLVETHSGFRYRDYLELSRGRMNPGPIVSVCGNFNLKLPMLSKTGQEIGALNLTSGKSGIYKINGDGTCAPVFDLPNAVGKMAFSYDGRYIAYHEFTTPPPDIYNRYTDHAPLKAMADLFLVDLTTGQITRLTKNVDGNSMFPEFLSDGRIIFMHLPDEVSLGSEFITLKL